MVGHVDPDEAKHDFITGFRRDLTADEPRIAALRNDLQAVLVSIGQDRADFLGRARTQHDGRRASVQVALFDQKRRLVFRGGQNVAGTNDFGKTVGMGVSLHERGSSSLVRVNSAGNIVVWIARVDRSFHRDRLEGTGGVCHRKLPSRVVKGILLEMTMAETRGLMSGKRGLIMGLANNKSIAWGIAKSLSDAGAELALTYQGDALKKRVEPLAEQLGAFVVGHCDVTEAETIDTVFKVLEDKWGKIDFVVHAVAFSDKEELTGRFVDTTSANFTRTMDISCYSLTAVTQRAEKLMTDGGSILTLTYYGAEKVMPHYNVMGVAKAALETSVRYLAMDLGPKNIRVNAISAGPIKTLAASGIGDFRYILKWNEYNSPLRRTVTIEEVGDSALFLLSDLSRGVTGEIQHVDCGYNIVGMKAVDAPDISVVKD